MLQKYRHIERIKNTGIIAVIRAETADEAIGLSRAVKEGGIDILEITFTVPDAPKVLDELRQAFNKDEILLGAGTVLDPETARIAMLYGAEFIVSPHNNPLIQKLCNRYRKLYLPGCATITEMIAALEAGAEIIKLFPGNLFGPTAVKGFKGPLPQAEFIPTGGVSLDNVQEWIKNGCLAVGVGGELTRGAAGGDYRPVTEKARQFVEEVRRARAS